MSLESCLSSRRFSDVFVITACITFYHLKGIKIDCFRINSACYYQFLCNNALTEPKENLSDKPNMFYSNADKFMGFLINLWKKFKSEASKTVIRCNIFNKKNSAAYIKSMGVWKASPFSFNFSLKIASTFPLNTFCTKGKTKHKNRNISCRGRS